MKRQLNFTSLFAVLLLSSYLALTGFATPAPTHQDTNPPQYFPQTGHTVQDPFIAYFVQGGGVAQYGYPITDDYVDPATHVLVQYFQYARLEWHPGNSDPYKVQLGLLGSELGKQTAPIPLSQAPAQNDPTCHYFTETGHSSCLGFRTYWLDNGGLDRFGFPITEWTIENGFLTQYYQRARMQWDPNGGGVNGSNVVLAPLGSMYYNYAGFDPTRLDPVGAELHLGQVTTLQARPSVFKSVAVASDSQTAFVYVTDQFGRPLSGVAVTLIVSFPQGDTSFELPPTNAGGVSFQTFALSQAPPGYQVPMTFVLSYPGLPDVQTRTSCLIWF